MFDEASDLWVLSFLLFMAIPALAVAYSASEKAIVSAVFLLTPFQTIETAIVTSSVLVAYAVFFGFVLRGRIERLPTIWPIVAVVMCLVASITQSHPSTRFEHYTYVFAIVSAFLLYIAVYNAVLRTAEPRYFVKLLITANWIVVVYSIIQITFGSVGIPGFERWIAMEEHRLGDDARFAGPFGVIGLTAEYFAIAVFVLAYEALHVRSRKQLAFLLLLATLNIGFLVATGNRGGFLVLIGGAILFLFLFRDRMTIGTIVNVSVAGGLALAIASFVILNYTQFDALYERLGDTEIRGSVPDTRAQTWNRAIEQIQQKPLLGHGPRLRLSTDFESRVPGRTPVTYPHNLYLSLLYTVGFIGLIAYLSLFATILFRIWRNSRISTGDVYTDGLSRLGVLIVILVAVDQLKIEFTRYATLDYLQFIFCVFAIFMAIGDAHRARAWTAVRPSLSKSVVHRPVVGGRARPAALRRR